MTAASALTLGANLTVTGAAGIIDSGTGAFDNLGTIIADPKATAATLTSGTFILNGTAWMNHGTIQAQNGGTILAEGTIGNFAAGTLTGGTWKVFASNSDSL